MSAARTPAELAELATPAAGDIRAWYASREAALAERRLEAEFATTRAQRRHSARARRRLEAEVATWGDRDRT